MGNCFGKGRSELKCYELKEPLTRLREELSQDANSLQYFDKHASKTRFVELGALAKVVKRVGKAMFADVRTNPLDEGEKLHWLQPENIAQHVVQARTAWKVQDWMLPNSKYRSKASEAAVGCWLTAHGIYLLLCLQRSF